MTDCRICAKCGQELALTMFVRSPDRRGGYRNICKPCYVVVRREREASLSPEERQRRHHQHKLKDKERALLDVDKARQVAREASQKHREKIRTIRAAGLPPPVVVSEKVCNECGQLLPIGCFYKLITSRDGHLSRCAECAKEIKRQEYRDNKEHLTAMRKARRPKYKAKEQEYNRYWETSHPGRKKELMRRWQQTHREKTREHANKRSRRKRLIATIYGQHTEEQWLRKIAEYDGKCAHCGTTEKITRDHIIPLSKGGTDLIDNIQPLCKWCNSRKGAKMPHDAAAPHPQMTQTEMFQ